MLQEEQDELSKQLVQHNSVWENSKQSLATEQESLNALERSGMIMIDFAAISPQKLLKYVEFHV